MKINLDEKEIYYTGDLNRQQFEVLLGWLEKNDTGWEATNIEDIQNLNGCDSLKYSDDSWEWELNEKQTKNAKELFYTLENIQVDCSELMEEQIKEMADVFENNGFNVDLDGITDEHFYLRLTKCRKSVDLFRLDDTKTIITYEKFMELFGENEKVTPYEEVPLKWNYETLVWDGIKGIETIDEVSSISSREKELKKTLKYLLKKDIILTPKQYKKLWKKS